MYPDIGKNTFLSCSEGKITGQRKKTKHTHTHTGISKIQKIPWEPQWMHVLSFPVCSCSQSGVRQSEGLASRLACGGRDVHKHNSILEHLHHTHSQGDGGIKSMWKGKHSRPEADWGMLHTHTHTHTHTHIQSSLIYHHYYLIHPLIFFDLNFILFIYFYTAGSY